MPPTTEQELLKAKALAYAFPTMENLNALIDVAKAEDTTKLCNLIERLEKRIPSINRDYANAYGDGRTDGMNVVLDALKHFVNVG